MVQEEKFTDTTAVGKVPCACLWHLLSLHRCCCGWILTPLASSPKIVVSVVLFGLFYKKITLG